MLHPSIARKILVTGGGTGIGLATAKALSELGHNVVVSGRRTDILKATGLPYVEMDVIDRVSVGNAMEIIGSVDVIVANAGQASTAHAMKMTPAQWHQMLAVNLTSIFYCAQAAIPSMIEQGFGRFIAIASTAGLKGYRYTSAYCAAKHGALGFIKSLALELASTGVTANAICPGYTDTPLVDSALRTIEEKTNLSRDEAVQRLVSNNPQGRLVDPNEVAACVSWLISDAADSVNGQALAIDGGETAS